MSAPEASASVLAWSWVIEALASCRDVDLDVLHDLIGATPNLSDNPGKEAREMVALRCLEALYDPAEVLKSDVSLSCNQKEFQFDSSECYSRVLQRVLDQTSVSSLRKSNSNPLMNLRKGASDQLVREVCAFIEHRKDSLPKCALEQLRDRLQKGDASLATNVKNTCRPEVESHDPDKWNKLLEEKSPRTTPVCLKRDRSSSQTEKRVQDCPIDEESGKSPPGKKLRHDGNCEMSDDASGRNAECEVTELTHEVPMGGREYRIPSDDNEQNIIPGKPVQSTGQKTCQHPDVLSEGDKMNVEETLHDNIENHHEGTNFSVIMSEDSLIPVDSTELYVCMKCKEGGEVFVCSASSCQMVVHERCLGFSANIDSRGYFLCPFCASSTALKEYTEAKKKMLMAREQLSLFIAGNPGPGHRMLDQPKGLSNINAHPPRAGINVDKRSKVTSVDRTSKDKQPEGPAMPSEDIPSKQKSSCLVDGVSKCQEHEGHPELGNTDTGPPYCSPEEREDITAGQHKNGKGHQIMQIEHFSYAGVHGGNPKLRPLQHLYGSSKNASCASSGDVNGTLEAKNFKANPSKNHLRSQSRQKSTEQTKDASRASRDDCDGTSQDENCGATTSRYSLRRQSQQKLADEVKNASTASLNDCGGTSEEEICMAIVPKYSLRPKGKETSCCNVYPARVLDRRVRVPWTAEEVEMLEKGVRRFSSGNMKVIPWRTIQDFGNSVFWRGRTTVDLKDKWRNMVRQGQVLS